MTNDLLKALARAKAAFQLQAIEAVICAPPQDQNPAKSPNAACAWCDAPLHLDDPDFDIPVCDACDAAPSCRKCGGQMLPGIAMGQTYTAGMPDFPGDEKAVTLSAGGPGKVIEAMKCSKCGWSVTK
jgi:ribosomal protein L40E